MTELEFKILRISRSNLQIEIRRLDEILARHIAADYPPLPTMIEASNQSFIQGVKLYYDWLKDKTRVPDVGLSEAKIAFEISTNRWNG